MALSKKGTRKITVGQTEYRWVVSPAADGLIVVTIQHAEGTGQLIRVYAKADVHDARSAGASGSAPTRERRAIKPSEVEAIITEAVAQGWVPEKSGAPLGFDWKGSTLLKRGR
ncbi:hypothetical protein BAG01nite_09390 [Brevibacillus agri]|uniref:Uncharacterized protein n=1 Tax=Brevibacillus agri TaxID=51101 RepID=A0A3M8A9X3_9BACL|nr:MULTISPECIES: hypothetical protein [Brevibacillus]EJL40003.1 hypothetical protein PMI08_04660 [Brevibacillus sp. CF112]MBY0051759.1 hypothetical protein [Brevibacillus agri]QAV14079.1 hypothetical protein BA6348_15710 [Brevibacillus agri]RNB48063.1 hypothetical protein EB820_23540 [Brevibacillus agri]WHX33209.1 hypothetical protein QNK09_13740 [Brevibacillus agri]